MGYLPTSVAANATSLFKSAEKFMFEKGAGIRIKQGIPLCCRNMCELLNNL
jgi:hypothetical protein